MLLMRKTRFSPFYFLWFFIGYFSFAEVGKTEAQFQPESQQKFEQIKESKIKSSPPGRGRIKINNSEWLEKLLSPNTFIEIRNKSSDKILYAYQANIPSAANPPGIDINQTEVFLVSPYGKIKGKLDGRTVVIDLSPNTYSLLLSSESEPIRPEFLNFSVYLQGNGEKDSKRKLIPFEKKIKGVGKVDLLIHKWGFGLKQIKVSVGYIGHQEKVLTLKEIASIHNRAILLSKPFNSVRGKIHVSNQKNEYLDKVALTIKNKDKVLWRSFSDNPVTSFGLSNEDVKDKDIEAGDLTLHAEKVGFKDKTIGLKRGENTIILEPNSIKIILIEKKDGKRFPNKEKINLIVWKENKNNEKTYILNSQVTTDKDGSFNFNFRGWNDPSIKVSIRAKGYTEVIYHLDTIAKYTGATIDLTKEYSEIIGLATVKDESGNRIEGASYTILKKWTGENGKEFQKVFSKGKSSSKGIIHFNYREEKLDKLKIRIEKVGYKPVLKKIKKTNFVIMIEKIKGFGVPIKVTVLDCFKRKIESPKGLLWVKPESGFLFPFFESSNEKESKKPISLHFPINYLPVARDKEYLFEYIEDGQRNYEYEVDGKNFRKGKIIALGTRQKVDFKIEVNGIKQPYSIIYSLGLDDSNKANMKGELNGIDNTIKGKVKVDCKKGKHLKIFFKGNKFYNETIKSIQLLPVEKQNTIFKEQYLTLRPSNIYIFVNTVGNMGKTLDHLNNVLPEIVSKSKNQKNNIKTLEVYRTKKGQFNKLEIDKLGLAPDPASEERPKELFESAVRDLSNKEGPGYIIYITNSTRTDRYPDLINSINPKLFNNKGVKFFSLVVGDHDSNSLKEIADQSFGQYKRVSNDKNEIRSTLLHFIENL